MRLVVKAHKMNLFYNFWVPNKGKFIKRDIKEINKSIFIRFSINKNDQNKIYCLKVIIRWLQKDNYGN